MFKSITILFNQFYIVINILFKRIFLWQIIIIIIFLLLNFIILSTYIKCYLNY
jgi:hypothetical protein